MTARPGESRPWRVRCCERCCPGARFAGPAGLELDPAETGGNNLDTKENEMDEIKVRVNSYGENRPLSPVYIDPVIGKKVAKSARTRDWREADGSQANGRRSCERDAK
jgi:hypothetical protein